MDIMVPPPRPEQAIELALGTLRGAFPGMTDQDILEGPMARHVCGPLPPWSTLEHHKLISVRKSDRGAFVLCWFKDASNEVCVLIGERLAKNASHTLLNGSGGGFANLSHTPATRFYPAAEEAEQPAQTAYRELTEEIRDNLAIPVLEPDPARFVLIDGGSDNRGMKRGGDSVAWYGYAVELNAAEVSTITQHCNGLATNPDYRAACFKASDNETAFARIMKLKDVAALPPERFAHPHELPTLKRLEKLLHCPVPH